MYGRSTSRVPGILRTLFVAASASLVALPVTGALALAPGGGPPAGAAAPAAELVAWGANTSGELGDGVGLGYSGTPVQVLLPAGVTPVAVAGGGGVGDGLGDSQSAYALGSDGVLYSWGDNSSAQLGVDRASTDPSPSPLPVAFPTGTRATAIAAGQGTAYALGSDGVLYSWGDDTYGALGDGTVGITGDEFAPSPVALPAGVTPTAISAGYQSGYALSSTGQVYAWGHNGHGELGNGSATDSGTPAPVDLPAGVTAASVVGGGGTAYAIGSDGNLYAWGYNADGGVGNGTTTDQLTPAVVTLAPGVHPVALAAGLDSAYAIGSDGNLYDWGDNVAGEMGNGSTTDQLTPEVVTLAPGVRPTSITADGLAAFAVGSDGRLYDWGGNGWGELGNGTVGGISTSPAPVALPPGASPTVLGAQSGSESTYLGLTPGTALSVATQPTPRTVVEGATATFTASAGGTTTPTVQWQVSTDQGVTWSPVAGATGDTLTVPAVTLAESGNLYEAVFTSSAGTVTSDPGSLTVEPPIPPLVTVQPESQTAAAGLDAYFVAEADGTPDMTEQWMVSTDGGSTWSPLPGETADSLDIPVATLAENGNEYEAVFTDADGTVASDPATLTVVVGAAPTVTLQPASVTVMVGQTATFTVAATGAPTPTIYWELSTDGGIHWQSAGGTGSSSDGVFTLTSGPADLYENGWEVRAEFTNQVGTTYSDPAVATVATASGSGPTVTTQPTGVTVYPDQTATFTAAASGTPTPTVQWELSMDGGATWAPVAGATSDSFTSAPAARYENGWEVRAVFTNAVGTAISDPAVATVTTAGGVAPTVTENPLSDVEFPPLTLTYTAAASGTPTPTVQWQLSTDGGATWSDVPGATSTTYEPDSSLYTPAAPGSEVRAVFTNFLGTAVTTAAGLVSL